MIWKQLEAHYSLIQTLQMKLESEQQKEAKEEEENF